jgi:hypothetical protein
MYVCTKIFLADNTVTAEQKTNVLKISCVSKLLVSSSIMPWVITQEDFTILLKCIFIFIILQFV